MKTPLEQFRVTTYIKIYNKIMDISITKTTIYLIIAVIIILMIMASKKDGKIVPNKIGRGIEIIYSEWEKQIKETIGREGRRHVGIIISIFMFVLMNNIIGLVPYSYTTTSQIIITITMSLTIFIGVTITGIKIQGKKFIYLFIPSGIPKAILPLLFIIELISYFFRIISLSVRLTGNMVAGHTILKIISSLGTKITSVSKLLIILPVSFLFLLVGLELGVAIIQSYVFAILTTSYIKDAYVSH